MIVFVAALVCGVVSAIVWPGDLHNEAPTAGHWVAVGGFLLTAVLLVMAAVLVVIAVVQSAWKVDGFDVNEYLDDVTRDR